ncbi:LysE family transporter [Reinekea marina]|uniref:LysE/ArgO family amino acid transporter n=1 Tax=Reinekea marina TaxID=1310421 RepID=A0ABV7WPM0_9GAMM|nr:LysE family transporter [Reinekea marina]MDN3648588.1 LysE family transporter [Reinekea marina]
MFAQYLSGFVVAIGLIVAIGAQNAWVLGMSIRRQYPYTIATVCFTIDALLMAVGVVALGHIQRLLPSIIPYLTYIGVAMLIGLGIQAFYRVFTTHQGLEVSRPEAAVKSRSHVIVLAMTLSLLNPHVYLDTVVLIGNIAAIQEQPWIFWLGSASASVAWFLMLAALGKPLSVWLISPLRWQIFDAIIGVIMFWVAWSLLKSTH